MTNWPGKEYGVRPPMHDETPLSEAEVLILIKLMLAGYDR